MSFLSHQILCLASTLIWVPVRLGTGGIYWGMSHFYTDQGIFDKILRVRMNDQLGFKWNWQDFDDDEFEFDDEDDEFEFDDEDDY